VDELVGLRWHKDKHDHGGWTGRPTMAQDKHDHGGWTGRPTMAQGQTQIHHSTRQISRETGLTQSSVVRIIHRDFGLKCPYLFTKMLISYYCYLFWHSYFTR